MSALRPILCLWLSISTCAALTPGRLPSGAPRRYAANKESPSSDLYAVEPKEARAIATRWMTSIAAQPVVPPEDEHLVRRFERLWEFAERERHVHLVWMPKGAVRDVLFLVVARVDADALAVSLLVPSPYWESSQIGSYKLKRSLEDLAKESGRALDLDLLYATDARHKLEWLGS